MQETQVQSLSQKDPLEEETATPSSILAWEIPRTEELDGLQSRDHKRVERDLMTKQQQAMCLERWKEQHLVDIQQSAPQRACTFSLLVLLLYF